MYRKVRDVSGESDTTFHIHWILKYYYGHYCIFYYVCRIRTSKKSLPEEIVGNVCIPVTPVLHQPDPIEEGFCESGNSARH